MKPWIQKLLPQHFLSRLVGRVANCRRPHLKNWMIKRYINFFGVNMDVALQPDYKKYETFNDFFIRRLKKEARPLCLEEDSIMCPVDGGISEIGKITRDRLIQAKNKDYDLLTLLGGSEELAKQFHHGHFATLYLAPKDYHRIHMPFSGKLLEMIHVPGRLLSVAPATVEGVPQLFAKNERVICIFDTPIGKMSLIFVGAIIVGSIATSWYGTVTPPTSKSIQQWNYENQIIEYSKGDEVGYFQLGSTVILLFQENKIEWCQELSAESSIKMGQKLGKIF